MWASSPRAIATLITSPGWRSSIPRRESRRIRRPGPSGRQRALWQGTRRGMRSLLSRGMLLEHAGPPGSLPPEFAPTRQRGSPALGHRSRASSHGERGLGGRAVWFRPWSASRGDSQVGEQIMDLRLAEPAVAPRVRTDPMRPAEAHRVTVLRSTLNIRATPSGVGSRSGFCTITGDSGSGSERFLPGGAGRCHRRGDPQGFHGWEPNGPAQRNGGLRFGALPRYLLHDPGSRGR
jgi:hypothetical protein